MSEDRARGTDTPTAADETDDETSTDPRLEEIQEDVDEIRARLPKNPGLGIPDPDVVPVMGEDEDTDPPV